MGKKDMSPLSQGRELKLILDIIRPVATIVAPLAGARIETRQGDGHRSSVVDLHILRGIKQDRGVRGLLQLFQYVCQLLEGCFGLVYGDFAMGEEILAVGGSHYAPHCEPAHSLVGVVAHFVGVGKVKGKCPCADKAFALCPGVTESPQPKAPLS